MTTMEIIRRTRAARSSLHTLTAEEKNEISHRGSALRVFAAELKEYLEKH